MRGENDVGGYANSTMRGVSEGEDKNGMCIYKGKVPSRAGPSRTYERKGWNDEQEQRQTLGGWECAAAGEKGEQRKSYVKLF